MNNIITKLIKKLRGNSQLEWRDVEYFDDKWKERIKVMAKYVPDDTKKLMDLGCGKMWTKEYIPNKCEYYGVDYTFRGTDSLIYNFNEMEFPDFNVDVIFVSGCLEYVEKEKWFISKISSHTKRCVVSYCTKDDFPNLAERRSLCWVNDLSESDLIEIFRENNMNLIDSDKTTTNNSIFIFENE